MASFYSMYRHGFVRTCVGIPRVRVADPVFNAQRMLDLAQQAHDKHAGIILFPELALSAYTCEDLFHQDALLEAVETAAGQIVEQSRELMPLVLVGMPLRVDNRLFNVAAVIHRGRILGFVPKSYLPNYREFYEKRQFAAAREALTNTVAFGEQEAIPFGNDLVFEAADLPGFSLFVETCEDMWTPAPPSTFGALAGATVLANLSASNITIGKADYRRTLCAAQSGRCVSAYLYSGAGPGESTNDLAWDGHALIYENGEMVAESARFASNEQIIWGDVDLGRLTQERMRLSSWGDTVLDWKEKLQTIRRVKFDLGVPDVDVPLLRAPERFPYVPNNAKLRDDRCYEAYNIQVHGLLKRLEATGIKNIVIGVSGGLDSTHALIVAAKTMDTLGLPRTNILAYTMPGLATSDLTYKNALGLMDALGVTAREIDIRPSSEQMLADINHPYAKGEAVYDVTFENVQAGERTSHLFRLANYQNAFVLGTGDLSELALGWATYGVGDHMSHYNVNASVPKTLIQYLLRWVIATRQFDDAASAILQSIVDTEISPELIPAQAGDPEGKELPAQSTEAKIGPYALQDFNIYYTTRYGFKPSKVAFLSYSAWANGEGAWPDGLPNNQRVNYDLPTIKKWLDVFLFRFFKISQFKRTCVPNSPKVGSGGSLSPRGDWRAPSDSEATVWLDELRNNVP